MSVIFDAMLILDLSDREGIEDLNKRLYEADVERHQQFGEVDMDRGGAGGTKVFTTKVYAAAFNHLIPDDVEECIIATKWRFPELVFYVCDLGDYYHGDYDQDSATSISFRSVAQLREEASV